jgi:hypothetical protein
MEKTESKTNDTSNIATFEHHDTLADSGLEAVTGGGYEPVAVELGDLKIKMSAHLYGPRSR